MPYKRPGEFYYATNDTGGSIKHGIPVNVDGVVGIAVKQRATAWDAGLAAQDLIAAGERYGVIIKGIVEVDNETGFAKPDDVHIGAAVVTDGVTTFPLTETAGGGAAKFGRVVEVVGEGRGVPDGKVRINLDLKDSF